MENLEEIELIGLPETAKIIWSTIYKNPEDHIADEDMVWIDIGNNLGIDAGQYGRESFFRVVVVNNVGQWNPIETVICIDTEEVAREIIRLANKYSNEEYYSIVTNHKDYNDIPSSEGWADGFNRYPNKNPYEKNSTKYKKYEYGYKRGVEEDLAQELKYGEI